MIRISQAGRKVVQHHLPVWLIRDFSIDIPTGRIVGLVGPNGAGKTTLMRMIAGLDSLSEGFISIDDTTIDSSIQSIGYLNEQAGLYQRLSVLENLRYQASLYHLSNMQTNQRIKELASALGINDLLNRSAAKLSQGERMRVVLARTMIHNPKYLLLDEPTNGLDLSSVIRLRQVLKRLAHGESQHGILISSHAMHELEKVADHLVVMDQGRLLMQGTTQHICEQTGTDNLEAAFAKLVYQLTDTE